MDDPYNPRSHDLDYKQMPDPLESKPRSFRKQETGSAYGFEQEPSDEEDEIYLVKQSYGYCSILFSIAQTVILAIMMIQCGVAPITINPMVGPYPGK